jgi:type II secretory pathway component HofQ
VRSLALFLVVLGAASASAAGKTVTLDVKDAEVRDVLASMKEQCGIRNMVIDPDVKGSGATLKFRDVPCETAFRVVLRQFGLTAQYEPSLTRVETRKR